MAKRWDVFISHAAEDKEHVAWPLAECLRRAGVSVWLDSNELALGDSIRRRIDEGLSNAKHGVVILSPSYFSSEWPQFELDGLVSRATADRLKILPVWHGIDEHFVLERVPCLADKLAISTEQGIDRVATAIINVVQGPRMDHLRTESWKRYNAVANTAATEEEEIAALRELLGDVPPVYLEPASLVGKTHHPFHFTAMLGAGGTRLVYRAFQTPPGREVAVKIFYPLASEMSELWDIQEAALKGVTLLDHPNIGRVYESHLAQSDKSKYAFPLLVCEYVRGEPLYDWNQKPGVDAGRRLRIAIQLTNALVAAHETTYIDTHGFEARGVLHGDIKPDNILVAENDRVKLLDFLIMDVQRLLEPRVAPVKYVGEQAMLTWGFGTPWYMAPEQEHHGILTPRCDIFSLGRTMETVFKQNGAAGPLGPAVVELITRMTSPSPVERPASMRAVRAELERIYVQYYGANPDSTLPH